MHERMTSKQADKLVKGSANLLTHTAQGKYDDIYFTVIKNLESVQSGLPDYRSKEITGMLQHAYYHRVKINFKGGNQDVAMECAKKYLKLYPQPPANDKYYNEIQDILLSIHGNRVAKLKQDEASKPKVQHPALPASIYRVHKSLHIDPPRTPEPFKENTKMAGRSSRVLISKSYTKGSKSHASNEVKKNSPRKMNK